MKLYRTSVKEDLNVAVVFQHLAENYVNKVRRIVMIYIDDDGRELCQQGEQTQDHDDDADDGNPGCLSTFGGKLC